VSLVWQEMIGKLYTEMVNTCKWDGYVGFNISKDGDSKYREF